ncbi:hypothetical protein ACFQYP_25965 [Nonomuraea antimicrobica]
MATGVTFAVAALLLGFGRGEKAEDAQTSGSDESAPSAESAAVPTAGPAAGPAPEPTPESAPETATRTASKEA